MKLLKLTMKQMVLILSFSICISSFAQSESETRGKNWLRFEVRGQVEMEGQNLHVNGQRGTRMSDFSVQVCGPKWYLMIRPRNWPVRQALDRKVSAPIAYELASDGSHVYELKSYDPEDFPPPAIARRAERWPGTTLLGKASLHEAYVLWHAFASHADSLGLSTNSIASVAPLFSWQTGHLETNSAYPFLPLQILTTNSEVTHRWEYAATRWTNMAGLQLPQTASLTCIRAPQNFDLWTIRVDATSFKPGCSRKEFVVDLIQGSCLVYDSTYDMADPPGVVRFETNSWPTSNEVRQVYESQRELNVRRAARNIDETPKSAWPWRIGIAMSLVFPLGMICRNLLAKRN